MSDTKQNIIKTISKTPLPAMFKPFYGGLGSILFMHKVVASKDPNKIRIPLNDANEVSISYLEELILYFKKKGYDIISLEDLPKRLNHASKDAKKFVIFTFDDGYKDNLTLAYPIFKKHQVPMTVYITNCFPNHSAKLWWYLLEDLVMEQEEISVEIANRKQTYSLSSFSQKEAAFHELRELFIGLSPEKQNKVIDALAQAYGKDLQQYVKTESLSWTEIKELSKDPLVTLGAHTLNHVTLNTLSKEDFYHETLESRKEISEKIGKEVRHFAYPFGTSKEVNEREVEWLGKSEAFTTATTTRIGNIFPKHKNHLWALPRIQVLGTWEGTQILEAYISGIVPALKNKFKKVVTL